MNSRFDEAIEQILNDLVVAEAAPGMSSLPGAVEPETKKKSFLGNLAKATLKGAGSALASGAKKAATLGAQAGAVGLGLTPNVGAKTAAAVGGAASTVGSTIKQAWQDRGAVQSAAPTGTASMPDQTNQQPNQPKQNQQQGQANQQPGSTPLNSLKVSSQTITNLSSRLGVSTQEKNDIKGALTSILPANAGTYRSQVPVSSVWSAVMNAADKTKRGAYSYTDIMQQANIRSFETNLATELRAAGVDPRDVNKLKPGVVTLLQKIPSAIPKQTVDATFTSLG